MKENKKSLLTLFFSTFRICACTFGGGFVILPLLKKRFSEELGWLDENEMTDLIAIAQSSPGAIAVNACTSIGYRLMGFRGALTALFGSVLPPFLIISVISLIYKQIQGLALVENIMKGVLSAVAAVILCTAFDMFVKLWKNWGLVLLAILALVLQMVFGVKSLLILVLYAVCGVISYLITRRRKNDSH